MSTIAIHCRWLYSSFRRYKRRVRRSQNRWLARTELQSKTEWMSDEHNAFGNDEEPRNQLWKSLFNCFESAFVGACSCCLCISIFCIFLNFWVLAFLDFWILRFLLYLWCFLATGTDEYENSPVCVLLNKMPPFCSLFQFLSKFKGYNISFIHYEHVNEIRIC